MRTIQFLLNGNKVICDVEDNELLLHMLRERFSLKSVKEGCGIGECGTCTVLIDSEPHYSCLTLASKVNGHDVKTVEHLGDSGLLHPLQEAFISSGAVQCGYCTPGMLLSAYSLLIKNGNPNDNEIKEAISGNLCRCTGYVQIKEAIGHASQMVQDSGFRVQGCEAEKKKDISRSAFRVSQSKEEVFDYLSKHEDAKIVAGGTDLLIALRNKDVEGRLVDITGLPELKSIVRENGQIRIGATATHANVSNNKAVANNAKSLSLACGWVGSPQIRNMGTIGGNLVNGSPAADSIPPLLVHDATLTLESKSGKRGMSLEDFIVAPYKTSIKQTELLTSIEIKCLKGYREGYKRVAKRATWVISRLSVAWAIKEKNNVYQDVRLAIGSCTPMPFRPRIVEGFLRGGKKDDSTIREAVTMVIEEIRRITGDRPSFVYKLPVVKDLVQKALRG